jgi:hypothetical protein
LQYDSIFSTILSDRTANTAVLQNRLSFDFKIFSTDGWTRDRQTDRWFVENADGHSGQVDK